MQGACCRGDVTGCRVCRLVPGWRLLMFPMPILLQSRCQLIQVGDPRLCICSMYRTGTKNAKGGGMRYRVHVCI